MKTLIKLLTMATLLGLLPASCSDDETVAVTPISPILKDVVMPALSDVMPGQTARIAGKGFSVRDTIYLTNGSETYMLVPVEVTDSYTSFVVPPAAGGAYTVSIRRDGKQTELEDALNVPYIIPLTNVVMPSTAIAQQGVVTIDGEGFEAGDMVTLSATHYPNGKTYTVTSTLTATGISFVLPANVYGVNTVVITRGARQNTVGTIGVETAVGDVLGGGVIYWVSTDKVHGLIAAKANAGSATEQWGPEVALNEAVGTTSNDIGTGASNTQKILAKLVTYRATWPEWVGVKLAAEWADEYSCVGDDGLTYTDWFLPSMNELIELFYAKSMLASKGATVPANNYWSSSENGGNEGWAATYVNFYEAVNLVTGGASKKNWYIGVRPVRSY
jgi:hypothetical protein